MDKDTEEEKFKCEWMVFDKVYFYINFHIECFIECSFFPVR